ncbi:MAG: hydroxymethylbilane synthase, partial [Selenomonadaceae bacterium]|nr:hydroxymethylbilane synthase [Selenomonadaceae bacterium]
GVYATANGEELCVEAVIASLDGKRLYRDAMHGSCKDAKEIGTALAEKLLEAGGREILHELGLLEE